MQNADTKTPWTPGPWSLEWDDGMVLVTVERPSGRYSDGPSGRQFSPDTRTIVTLRTSTEWNAEADARLIAAAPDLYEALDGLLVAYTRTDLAFDELSAGERRAYFDAKENAARAALARARGDAQ